MNVAMECKTRLIKECNVAMECKTLLVYNVYHKSKIYPNTTEYQNIILQCQVKLLFKKLQYLERDKRYNQLINTFTGALIRLYCFCDNCLIINDCHKEN